MLNPLSKKPLIVSAGLGSLSLIYSVNAAVVLDGAYNEDIAFYTTNDVTVVPSVYDADYSRTDLIAGDAGTATGAWAFGTEAMTDGLSGSGATYSDSEDDGGYPNVAGDYVVWDLGAGANGLGHDITSVVSIAGWNSGAFYKQYFTLSVQGVGDGSGEYTDVITVSYVPSSDPTGSSRVTLTEDTTGILAKGVQYVRLTQHTTGTVYREFDVFGTASSHKPGPYSAIPEPRSYALLVTFLAVSCMAFRRRK